MVTVSSVTSDLQGTVTTELFKDAEAPVTNLFHTVMVKNVSFGHS